MASLFTLLLFSLAGIPPFIGFIGKFAVFRAAVDANLVWLAVVGGVAAVVAAGYYLRLLASIWFQPSAAAFQPSTGTIVVTASLGAALTLALVPVLGIIQQWAEAAARMLH
jgi:NADH-quinone oxidoreductase subunit N